MRLQDISGLANQNKLDIFGVFHPEPDDLAPKAAQTIVLLGPQEPGFWAHFQDSAEYLDDAPDPMDRWSIRVITALAQTLNATALFPFGGPPFQPFIRWAMRSGRAWQSPAGPLVHDTAGMMVSYRGALAVSEKIEIAPPSLSPCETCADKPCLTACPVNALSARTGYDLAACHSFLDSESGQACMQKGCAARRACPVSKTYARMPAQSAFHMESFHK